VIPLSDEGPTNDDRCEIEVAATVEIAIRKSSRWSSTGTTVKPFHEYTTRGNEVCRFDRDPKYSAGRSVVQATPLVTVL
jgi:hypothetical protein